MINEDKETELLKKRAQACLRERKENRKNKRHILLPFGPLNPISSKFKNQKRPKV